MFGAIILLIITLWSTYAACMAAYESVFVYGDKIGCGIFLALVGCWWYALISGVTVTIN